MVEQVQTEEINLTQAAVQAVVELLEKRELTDHALRVFVSGGGCSGYQYGMALEPELKDNDVVMEKMGIKIVVDDVSYTYLQGATIDYVDDVMGSGFKIDNPNAVSSCGCGNSFSTEDGGGHKQGCNC